MSKTTRRVLSMVLTVLMVVSMLSSFSVTVFAATPAFKDAYTCAETEDDGVTPVIGRDALLVSYSITEADGTEITRSWDGADYTFVVGDNAFSTLPKALDHAKSKGIAVPDVIMTDTKNGNLNVGAACNIYAPNWNTVPYIRDAQDGEWKAVNSDGADWEINPEFTAKTVKVNNVIIDGLITGELGIYGFTVRDQFYLNGIKGGNTGSDGVATAGNYRTNNTAAVTMTFGNIMVAVEGVSAQSSTTSLFNLNANASAPNQYWGNQSESCTDTVIFKNVYFNNFRKLANGVDTSKIRSQLFPDVALAPNMVFDGCYLDWTDSNLAGGSWFKQGTATKNTSVVWKNSNIRNIPGVPSFIQFAAGRKPTNSLADGQTSELVFDNNIFWSCKSQDSGMLYIRSQAYTDIEFTNNFAYTGFKFEDFRVFASDTSVPDTNVTVIGNKLLGFDFDYPVDHTVVANDTYLATGAKAEYIDKNFLVNVNTKVDPEDETSKVALTLDDYKAATGSPLNGARGNLATDPDYYIDYDMKYLASDLEVTGVRLGEQDSVSMTGSDIVVQAESSQTPVVPTFTCKNEDTVVVVSTKADFSDTVDAIDVSEQGVISTYYVKAYFPGHESYAKEYTMTVGTASVYEIALAADNAYIINGAWTAEQLTGTADLTFWFSGKERTVNPTTHKLFNSYTAAADAAYAELTPENYFTLNPTFIWAPGDYSTETVTLRAPATLYGANAGINPNAEIAEGDWTIDYVEENSGWPANPDRVAANESTLGLISYSTRVSGDYNDDFSAGFSGDGARWAYNKEKAYDLAPDATAVVTIDGINSTGAHQMITFTGHQYGGTLTYGGDSIKINTKNHKTTLYASNITSSVTSAHFNATNTTHEVYTGYVSDSRFTSAASAFVEKYFGDFNVTDCYITGFSGGSGKMTKQFNQNSRHSSVKMTINDSILYNMTANSEGLFNITVDDNAAKSMELELVGNIMYNAGNANYGDFRPYNVKRDDVTLTYDIRDNLIYRDVKTNTLFNGNPKYVTMGKVYIFFNGNRVISTNSAIPPNSNYTDEQVKAMLYYDFSDNFWSTSIDGVGKEVSFHSAGRPASGDGYTAFNNWNWRDPDYYLDYGMTVSTADTRITAIDLGDSNYADKGLNNISVSVVDKSADITTDMFTVKEGTTIAFSKSLAGTETTDTIPVSELSGSEVWYVLTSYTAGDVTATRSYKMLVSEGPALFNDAVKDGIEVAGYSLNADNTGVLTPSNASLFYIDQYDEEGSFTGTVTAYHAYWGGRLWQFNIDGELVVPYTTKTITQPSGASQTTADISKFEGRENIAMPSGSYNNDFNFPFAANYLGANVGVNPIDKSGATAENGYDWKLSSEWSKEYETIVTTTNMADMSGELVVDGFTQRYTFWADWMSIPEDVSTYKPLNITVKNYVHDDNDTTSKSTSYMFTLGSARATNKTNAEFGAVYNDSVTLQNIFVEESGVRGRLVNEYVPANVTIDNLYYNADVDAGTCVGFFKTGAANVSSKVSLTNANIRNSTNIGNGPTTDDGDKWATFTYEGVVGNDSSLKVLPETHTAEVNVSDNIFFNPECKTIVSVVSIEAGVVSKLTIDNNTFINANGTDYLAINNSTKSTSAGNTAIVGNISIDGNRFVGYTLDNVIDDFKLGENNPVLTNTYIALDTNAYLDPAGLTGVMEPISFVDGQYVDFNQTVLNTDMTIASIEAGTSAATDIRFNNDNDTMELTLTHGTTEGIVITFGGEGVEGVWSKDADGEQVIDAIKREELVNLATTYYYTLKKNGVAVTYTVNVFNNTVPEFATVEGLDPAYFSNQAVIVTDKAANAAAGTQIVEEWDGKFYRFYAGVNAYDTYENALKDDAEIVEILIKEYKGNTSNDLVVSRSMKLFTPNYKTNPVISDGYGTESPTYGAGWGYNTAYDKYKDAVRIKNVSTWTGAGEKTVELYGVTIDCGVYDNGRQIGSTIDYKVINSLFTLEKGGDYIFSFGTSNSKSAKYDYMTSDQRNTFYVQNAYFAQTEKTNIRLIGELIPSKVTFDNIYVDFELSGFTNYSYIKPTSSDSCFTIKNSYLAHNRTNSSSIGQLQFETMLIDGGDGLLGGDDKTLQAVPEGWTSALVFEDNIFNGVIGRGTADGGVALIRMNGSGFNDIQINGNYFKVPETYNRNGSTVTTKTAQLFWSMQSAANENGGSLTELEGTYSLTGNIFDGLAHTTVYYNNGGGDNGLVNYDITVADNYISTKIGGNINDIIGVAPNVRANDSSGIGAYRLTPDGSVMSNVINAMTWSQRVSFSGTTALVNIYEGDDLVTVPTEANGDGKWVYEFDLSSLVKENKYGNVVTAAYADGAAVNIASDKLSVALDGTLAANTGIQVTVTVDSVDGTAEDEVYTFVLFLNGGDAPAFKGNFTDESGIISDNAVIVTGKANGTDTVNVQWLGETYSFVSGTNAFATVADALEYAKANADAYAASPIEILLSESVTDLNIDYSCKIYAENYNTLPYTTDGYGIDSVTHGEGWGVNADYTGNQTSVRHINISSATPKDSVIELHGVTINGLVADARRAGNTASILLNNIYADVTNVNMTKESGVGASYGSNYWLNLGSESSKADKGNVFTLKNTYIANLANYAIVGEYIPHTMTFDGLYVDGAAESKCLRSTWWIKYNVDGTTLTFQNSNLQKVMKSTNSTSTTWMNITGADGATGIKANIVAKNNIFNSMQSRTFANGAGSLFDITSHLVNSITFEDNYIANPYNEVSTSISLISTNGQRSVLEESDIDITVRNNVLNSTGWIDIGVSGTYIKNLDAVIEGNYRTAEYVSNISTAGIVGVEQVVSHFTPVFSNYALDYDRTIMSDDILDYGFVDADNVLIDEDEKVITYAYDSKVFKAEDGTITVDLSEFIDVHKYNTAVLVLEDGTEKANTLFTYTGTESVKVKVYSYDGTASETVWTINFAEPTHSFSGEWTANGNSTCDGYEEVRYCDGTACTVNGEDCDGYETREIATPGNHKWDDGHATGDATCQSAGTVTYTCTECGNTKQEASTAGALNYHKYTEYTVNTEGNCSVDGTKIAYCDWCGTNPSVITNADDLKTAEHNVNDHTWGDHIYNADATCIADGTQTCYCINEDASGAVCGAEGETVTAEDTMLEHDFSEYVYQNNETDQNDGTEIATCPGVSENGTVVECVATHERVVAGTKLTDCVFQEEDYVLTSEATCVAAGRETAPCKFAYDGCTATHERENAEKYPINPDNHDLAKAVYQEDATCTKDGTTHAKCKRGCGYIDIQTAVGTAGQGTHVFGEYVAQNNATCVVDGTMVAKCTNEGCTAEDVVTNPDDPATKKAHTWGGFVYNNDATCAKDGTKTRTCLVADCGATDTEKDTDHLKATVAHTYGAWVSNNDATCKADGTKTRACTVDRCYHEETVADAGSKKAHTYGEYVYNNDATYFADGTKTAACSVCGTKDTVTAAGTKLKPKDIQDTSSKFIDVGKNAWYKKAVDYAVTYGFISGVTETEFKPNDPITRAMFVTILARIAGVDTSKAANQAAKTQFNDVAAGKYYTAAIAWAASKDIVAGISTTEFAPNTAITRQQLATMIVNYARAHGIALKEKTSVTFADASSVSRYAKEAVAACAKAGIISGYSENGAVYFKPNNTATRAEATQMIYKFHSEYITGTAK